MNPLTSFGLCREMSEEGDYAITSAVRAPVKALLSNKISAVRFSFTFTPN